MTQQMNQANGDWIAVDWGTTHIRAWAMTASGDVLAHGISDKGMNQLSPEAFEPALLELIACWLPEHSEYLDNNLSINVVACGMVGAKQGWVEAAYQVVPCFPAKPTSLTQATTLDKRIQFFILPGLMQIDPMDIMRGEECQIAGLLSHYPDFDAVVCLPGTHSKWARVSRQQVMSFSTHMTGELFSLLAQQSVLRHSVSVVSNAGTSDVHKICEESFQRGVEEALAASHDLGPQLFSIRAESIISDKQPVQARSRLSGLLIGSELRSTQHLWKHHEVSVIGSDVLANIYIKALNIVGAKATLTNGTHMTLAGLTLAHDDFIGCKSF